MKAVPLEDSESDEEDNDLILKRVKLMREQSQLEEPVKRFVGGIVVSTDSDTNNHLTSASLSAAEKKGRKEVEELERELDLKNTFSKETNRRDEDAEMKKYIDEQMRLRLEAAEAERKKGEIKRKPEQDHNDSELAELFALPVSATDKIEDILLHSLAKNQASTSDERSEAMLSSQMLNGIPEVDLGITERIRTIEATEEAKLRMASSSSSKNSSRVSSAVPVNFSSNFQQHRSNRDTRDGQLKTAKPERTIKGASDNKTVIEAVVNVGEKPDEVEYRLPSTGERPPPRGKASDDYYLSKFKKNNRK